MSASIVNILPKPAPPPPPPAASNSRAEALPSAGQAETSDFSQQLSKAKSKPSHSAPAPSQPSNAAASSTAKKTQTKSAQLKDKSNPQQKQQNAKANPSDAAETETQAQTQVSEPTTDEQANVADVAQNTPLPVHATPTNVLSLQPVNPATGNPDAKPVAGKPAAQKTDQPSPESQTSPDLTTLTTAASAQQPPVAAANTTAKTATVDGSASNEDPNDAATLKQTSIRPNVSPFKPADSTADTPTGEGEAAAAQGQASADAQLTAAADADAQLAAKDKAAGVDLTGSAFAELLPGFSATNAGANQAQPAAAPSSVGQSPVAQFAEANQPSIVSTIHGSLLPNGGTMNITLNPPDLGAMQITVRMEDGVMSATFQTSNDQATRLLSHTLGQLKEALETQGVSVDRLHVQQSSNSGNSSGKGNDSESGGQQSSDGRSAQQEQQRRETLRRMWRRIRGDNDPLDLVA
ncbi:MAG: flagellar hook-length control protein FliK [Tepidisphaeraceae bacterium]|jgi:flagellar hook-length control protein FliK